MDANTEAVESSNGVDSDHIEICLPEVSLDKFSICNLEIEKSNLDDVPRPGGPSPTPSGSPAVPNDDSISNISKTPEPAGGDLISDDHSSFLEAQANFRKTEERCQELSLQLTEKDLLISTLRRSCGLLEKEATLSKRELEISLREKESAVMRYAIVEKKVIDANLSRDSMEKKQKESLKEVEVLNHKIRQMTAEKTRMCQIVEQKCGDIRHYQREMEKLKMDISMWESTNKASTAKLKQETEAKATAEQRISELVAEVEAIKSAEKAAIKSEVDGERLQVLEKQSVEQQAALILFKHEGQAKDGRIEELERRLAQVTKELKEDQERHSTMTSENSTFKAENAQLRNEIFDVQNTLDREVLKVAELQAKANDLESIRAQLRIERDSNAELTNHLSVIRADLEDCNSSLDNLRRREEELLAINQELTECMAKVQNELSLLKSKSMALTLENEAIGKEKLTFDTRYADLEKQLKEEKRVRSEEKERSEQELTESRALVESLEVKISTALGDTEALKNKHNQSLKELSRELMLMQKKCAKLEERENRPQMQMDSNSDGHSTKSDNLSDSESMKNGQSSHEVDARRKASDSSLPGVSILEPSKQSLIDRIVRLQQANAKQTEKVDFLENHSATLVAELQKKSKLVHYYMMRDQSGALVSSKSDKNKAELAKYGGIMSAIYGGMKGSASSTEMTLDLSLEINRKLQAVLEDTLLKNITLKENLDTLGLEVDKLLTRKK